MKFSIRLRIAAAFLAVITTLPAAALTVKDYRAMTSKGGDSLLLAKTYVMGVGDGLQVANTLRSGESLPPLYCQPPNLALNGDNYMRMVDDQLARAKTPDDMSIDIVLYFALKDTLPCGKK